MSGQSTARDRRGQERTGEAGVYSGSTAGYTGRSWHRPYHRPVPGDVCMCVCVLQLLASLQWGKKAACRASTGEPRSQLISLNMCDNSE
jgi:hypothetical protein